LISVGGPKKAISKTRLSSYQVDPKEIDIISGQRRDGSSLNRPVEDYEMRSPFGTTRDDKITVDPTKSPIGAKSEQPKVDSFGEIGERNRLFHSPSYIGHKKRPDEEDLTGWIAGESENEVVRHGHGYMQKKAVPKIEADMLGKETPDMVDRRGFLYMQHHAHPTTARESKAAPWAEESGKQVWQEEPKFGSDVAGTTHRTSYGTLQSKAKVQNRPKDHFSLSNGFALE
jgi:hypothetical protein